jgi:hypothetical protein
MQRFAATCFAALVTFAGAAPASDIVSGKLVSTEDDGRAFTVETAQGERHKFRTTEQTSVLFAGGEVSIDELDPGTDLRVTAEDLTAVEPDPEQHRTALAVEVAPPALERTGDEGGGIPRDPATGAPGGGPPSGGIPGGGVPSGGAPGGGMPSGSAP